MTQGFESLAGHRVGERCEVNEFDMAHLAFTFSSVL